MENSNPAFRRIVPALVGVTAFAAVAALYLSGDRTLYALVLTDWGIVPFRFPFLDTDTVLAALRCRRLGVDVFAINPCDALGRIFDYSPFWLLASGLPVTTAWIAPVGLALNLSFLASLALLPPGRGWRDTALIAAGVVSTEVVYAAERGNNDLVIFVLAACAASLACRGRGFRLVGYALALLAGLLKYYPLALLAQTTRERPRRFAVVALMAAAVLATLVAIDRTELSRALALIPGGPPTGDMFGARITINGLTERYHWHAGTTFSVELTLLVGAFVIGGILGFGTTMRADLTALCEPERAFLLAGGLLIVGCFLTAENNGYRAVHLLLLLPGVTALWRVGRHRTWYGISAVVLLVLLWSEGWRNWLSWSLERPIPGTEQMRFAGWLLREAGWWWTVTLLIALIVGLSLRSEMGRVVTVWLARRGFRWAHD